MTTLKTILSGLLAAAAACLPALAGEEGVTPLPCQVLYELTDGLYVNVGVESGLREGAAGWLLREGVELARVECTAVTLESSFLHYLTAPGAGAPLQGATVTLAIDTLPPAPVPEKRKPSSTLKDQDEEQDFVPLLSPAGDFGISDPRNVLHGNLRLRQYLQETSDNHLDYQRTHLSSSGSLERMGGTPWSLEWSGELSYRSGDGLENVRDFEEVRLEVYEFSASRRFDDASTLRLGRFVPRALPSVGYMDALQGEKVLSGSWRLGGVAGFKPGRYDLDPSFDEPTFVPYATYFWRGDAEHEYSITGGVLTALYEGDLDRVALLADQQALLGRWRLWSSTVVDLDVGAFETRDGVRLSRQDLSVSHDFEHWTPRVGLDRFELPDTEAERDLVDDVLLNEADFFQDGYWRYWVGANHRLGAGWSVDEEVSYMDSETIDGWRWRVSVSKASLFGLRTASSTLSVYNLLGDDQEGYGAHLAAFFPLAQDRVVLQPSLTFRAVEFDTGGADFEFTDVSLRGLWYLTPRWSAFGGASYSLADAVDRVLVEVGVTWRF